MANRPPFATLNHFAGDLGILRVQSLESHTSRGLVLACKRHQPSSPACKKRKPHVPEIHDLSAVELLELYRRKALSPVEATRAVLAQIERWEPTLCATYRLDPDAALAAAEASEARWREGRAGALDGVPVMIKDNIATKGVPVPLGTAATALQDAAEDAPPAARVREAGAVILGKTTMPDYGMLSS